MSTITVSATYARNNFFGLLERIKSGVSVVISRDKEEIAVMTAKKKRTNLVALNKAVQKVHGIAPDMRLEDSPLRQSWSWPSLGQWDK